MPILLQSQVKIFVSKYLLFFYSVNSKDGWLNVEWDTGSIHKYRYGSAGLTTDKFDVQVCIEPRILNAELIATGCNVTRGNPIQSCKSKKI